MSSPSKLKHSVEMKSVSMLRRALFVGLVCGVAFVIWVEGRARLAESVATREVQARAFIGPTPKAMSATSGGDWLNVRGFSKEPIKMGVVKHNQTTGPGDASARGGPGSSWGPTALTQSASVPGGAWGNFNAPLTARNYTAEGATSYPTDLRLAFPDPALTRGMPFPRSLRYRDDF